MKKLDQFYTNPEIGKLFVNEINKISPLENFDQVIEPSAGSGNILQYLPSGSLGFDLEPKGPGIVKMDWFDYESEYHPLFNPITIAVVGNPPFGTGYMNPLAKGFFNHASKFASLIAFIVPAKYHTSWKVHKGLDSKFGLYYSKILPKNSFVFMGKPYDVNCCMQIWSQIPLSENLRIMKAPPTNHPDFDFFLTCDNVKRLNTVREQLKNGEYWEFALKYWGNIRLCEMDEVPIDTTTHYLFVPKQPYVREILEQIDWADYVSNMGAPNVGGKSTLIKAYTDKKLELGL
jgi:hypothetical protein